MSKSKKNIYDILPETNHSSIEMNDPNQKVQVFKGEIKILNGDKTTTIDGEICLDWFPFPAVRFSGMVKGKFTLGDFFDPTPPVGLEINEQIIGTCHILKKSIKQGMVIEGAFYEDVILGDSTIPVAKVRFLVPNLKYFHGEPTKFTDKGSKSILSNRIILVDEKYTVTLDSIPNFSKLQDDLNSKGGYLFQYCGEITNKRASLNFQDLRQTMLCLSDFLSFINGRRCSPYCLQGLFDDSIIWSDYTPLKVSQYKHVGSWSIDESVVGFNDLWGAFVSMWVKEEDRNFIKSIIHWYLEANFNSGYIEGSIIMTQVGLELAYNWYVIEKKRLIVGDDAVKMSASNKIRLLISQVGISPNIPASYDELDEYVKKNQLSDGIEALVQIRNALVHSQVEKRKELTAISNSVMFQALHLGLHYLELSILSILRYKGKYRNRCTRQIEEMNS